MFGVTNGFSGINQQPNESELSLFAMSDNKVLDLIYATHVHSDEAFDEDSLFIIVESILKRATNIVDKIFQGSHVESIEEKSPNPNFSVPSCVLKQIGGELTCIAQGEETAHEKTISILNKLSTYTWEAKAVLTLAAFALEFGDFWHLAQRQESDPLAKALATLKGVPVTLKNSELQKRMAVLELNGLVRAAMQVVAIFDEFDKLSVYDPKEVPGLPVALDRLPVDVYWLILTVVACSAKICALSNDNLEKANDLSPYGQKIHYILTKLNNQLTLCRKQIEEVDTYRRIRKIFQTPTEVMEVFKALIFSKDKVQPLIDGSRNKTVNIQALKKRTVMLLFSSLDIHDDDISVLRPVHEATKKDDRYKIVWVPIVEEWTDEIKRKFEAVRSKMPWHLVQYYSPIAGIRFVKDQWNYEGKPIVVVLSPQGRVENPNALHMIRVWGMKAFPFDKTAEENMSKERSWIGPVVNDIHPTIQTWIKEEKYIFFYGGKDNEWVQRFAKKATALVNDSTIKETLKINMELFCVGKTSKGGDDGGVLGKFWSAVESLFFTKFHRQQQADPVTQEIQKLLSYKNESGWAVLSKGSAVVLAGHGSTVLRSMEEFDKWKDYAAKEAGFDAAFKEYHAQVAQTLRHCCCLEFPSVAGKAPEAMQCPECQRIMETFVTYKCSHGHAEHH